MAEFRQFSFKIMVNSTLYTLQMKSVNCKVLIKLYEFFRERTPGYFKTSQLQKNNNNNTNKLNMFKFLKSLKVNIIFLKKR